MSIMSLRLGDDLVRKIGALSKREKKDKSTVARELIEYGLRYRMVKLYREGKASLGTVSKALDCSLSETLDLLAEFGVQAPIDYDEYLAGYRSLKKVF